MSKNSDSFEAQLPRSPVGARNILSCRFLREVDRLGDGVIDILLKGRLHLEVPIDRNFQGGFEEFFYLMGKCRQIGNAPSFQYFLLDALDIQIMISKVGLKEGINFDQN